jgi:hypothetical protein
VIQYGTPTSLALWYRLPIAPVWSYMTFHRPWSLVNNVRATLTRGSLFLTKGSTATFTGAMRGWKDRYWRTSPFCTSSAYAEEIRASRTQSTPNDCSMTWGVNFFFVSSSK